MNEDQAGTLPGLIRKTPGAIGGDACVGNRRIAVWMLVQAQRLGLSDKEIRNRYEQPLSEAELAAAWDYYANHREEIERAIRENVYADENVPLALVQNHAGIITFTDDPDTQALAQRIHDAHKATVSLSGVVIRVVRPP